MFGGGSRKEPSAEEVYAELSGYIRNKDGAGLETLLKPLKSTAPLNLTFSDERLPLLILAALQNEPACCALLVESRAEIGLTDSTGATACFVAARNNCAAALEVLIGAGAPIDQPRISGATPLYIAAQNESLECLSMLLEAKADVNAAKEGGFTPLAIATLRNKKASVSMLIEAGARVDQAYDLADRFTPLMLAAHCNHIEIVSALIAAGASPHLLDAARRTPRQIATAQGHEMASSVLLAAEETVERENELASQEATLQELRHLQPVRHDLEVEASRMEALQVQCASFASEQGVFSAAQNLQELCLVIAQALLPAKRLVSQLSTIDEDVHQMEEQLRSVRGELDLAIEAVRASPSDGAKLAARDKATERYGEALRTLRVKYEERQQRGNKYLAATQRVASHSSQFQPSEANLLDPSSPAPSMVDALSSALPVLKKVIDSIGDANRATLAAMDALSLALRRELDLISQVKQPLQDACDGCLLAIANSSTEVLQGTPSEDLEQLDLLLSRVRCQEAQMMHARTVLDDAQRGIKTLDDIKARELQLEDEIDELGLAITKATRRAETAEVDRLGGERARAVAALAELREEAVRTSSAVSDPTLVEWYPELTRVVRLKAGADWERITPSNVVDETLRREQLEIGGESARGVGWSALNARHRASPLADALLYEVHLPRSEEFEAKYRAIASLSSPLLPPSRVLYDRSAVQPLTLLFTPGVASLPRLDRWVGASKAGAAPLAEVRAKMCSLLRAVALLHSAGVRHGALSPSAVVCRPDGSLGLLHAGFPTAVGGALSPYDAPETAYHIEGPSAPFAVDVWSVGAILLELLQGRIPRWNNLLLRIEDTASSAPLEPPSPLPDGELGDAWRLCSAMLRTAPGERISAVQALQSPFFAPFRPYSVATPIFHPESAAASAGVTVQVPTDKGYGLVLPLLSGCAALGADDELRILGPSGVQLPAAMIISAFFAAVGDPTAGLLQSLSPGAPPLPRAGQVEPQLANRYRALGRLLGHAATRGLHVPLPLPAALLFFLTRGETLTTDVSQAVALVASVDPPTAHELRCLLSKRHGLGSGPPQGALAKALGASACSDLVLTDKNKRELALTAAHNLLVGCRLEALGPLRAGMKAVLGDLQLELLQPQDLGCNLLGWEQPPSVEPTIALNSADWGDATLRSTYSSWLKDWTASLDASRRCLYLLLTFGALSSESRSRRIAVLPAPGDSAVFVPDAGQLFLPAASSAAEFNTRMLASLVL